MIFGCFSSISQELMSRFSWFLDMLFTNIIGTMRPKIMKIHPKNPEILMKNFKKLRFPKYAQKCPYISRMSDFYQKSIRSWKNIWGEILSDPIPKIVKIWSEIWKNARNMWFCPKKYLELKKIFGVKFYPTPTPKLSKSGQKYEKPLKICDLAWKNI